MDVAEFARRQIASARADLTRDTERVTDAAARIHAEAQAGRDVTGDLERLIQYATTALHRAARLRGAEETAVYLADGQAGAQ